MSLDDIPDSEPFNCSAFEEGNWPENPGTSMWYWMGRDIVEEFGWYDSGMLDDGWGVIRDIDGLLPWPERAGARCQQDDDLRHRACWG